MIRLPWNKRHDLRRPRDPCFVRALVAAGALALATSASAEAEDAKADVQPAAGTIEGTLTYKSDARRPWRYGRYYVRAGTGELSGVLVSLDGAPLEESAARKEAAHGGRRGGGGCRSGGVDSFL